MLISELFTLSTPLYSISPSLRNLFMKKFTRERVVPTISASVSCDNFGRTRTNHKVHINVNVAPSEVVRVRITGAQRATLEGELQNGNVTFENFRQEDSSGLICP